MKRLHGIKKFTILFVAGGFIGSAHTMGLKINQDDYYNNHSFENNNFFEDLQQQQEHFYDQHLQSPSPQPTYFEYYTLNELQQYNVSGKKEFEEWEKNHPMYNCLSKNKVGIKYKDLVEYWSALKKIADETYYDKAQWEYGCHFLCDKDSLKKKEGFDYLKKAAQRRVFGQTQISVHSGANYTIGCLYLLGFGSVSQSLELAREHLTLAAEVGHSDADLLLKFLKKQGLNVAVEKLLGLEEEFCEKVGVYAQKFSSKEKKKQRRVDQSECKLFNGYPKKTKKIYYRRKKE